LDKKPDRGTFAGPDAGDGGWSWAVLCTAMASFLSTIILPIAVAAVALVLLLGLLNMMRGGSPNRSQKLMRLRVLLQFVAIIITMLTVWAMGH
jgi:Hypoxia induced protein conserved region